MIGWLWAGAALLFAFVLFWKFWFLRMPARTVPALGIVSPASGLVTRIIPFSKGAAQRVPKGVLGAVRTLTADVAQRGCMVVIMLSPLDVHYQRAPIAGTVVSVRYTRGTFRNAVVGGGRTGAFENEKNEVLIASGREKVKVVQVAGFAARRIESFVAAGQALAKGEVLGRINLGSQVLLVLARTRVRVRVGQRVVDGETVIA